MGLNLHAVVRGSIQAVNRDITVRWLRSTGYGTDVSGEQTPLYAAARLMKAQVQPAPTKALQHPEYMNMQGSMRSGYMYGYPEAIDRVEAKGGDLLQFPQYPRAPHDNWLVVMVDESGWELPYGGWARVTVVLQLDRPPIS